MVEPPRYILDIYHGNEGSRRIPLDFPPDCTKLLVQHVCARGHRLQGPHPPPRPAREGDSAGHRHSAAQAGRPAAHRPPARGRPAPQREHGGARLPGAGAGGGAGHPARGGDVHRREGAEVGARGASKTPPQRADRSISHRDRSARIFAGRGDQTSRPASNGRSEAMIIPVTATKGEPRQFNARVNVVSFIVLLVFLVGGLVPTILTQNPVFAIAGMILGPIMMQSPKVAKQWEKGVVLRLGKFVGLRGPGLFWIVPLIDTVSLWIDQRVITTSFAAEQTLTRDTVPVNVDAVLFWMVYDPEKAALEVQAYRDAVSWAAQTALRDIIGRTNLQDLLRGRERIEEELQKLIDQRSNPWGVTLQSVEMRDVIIPAALQDAMSREAQAAREKQARIILGQAEVEIAHSFEKAAQSYRDNPTALHLRAMNMLYEGLKEKGALMLVPSSAVESMGMGGLLGAAAFRQQALTGTKDDIEIK